MVPRWSVSLDKYRVPCERRWPALGRLPAYLCALLRVQDTGTVGRWFAVPSVLTFEHSSCATYASTLAETVVGGRLLRNIDRGLWAIVGQGVGLIWVRSVQCKGLGVRGSSQAGLFLGNWYR